MFSVVGILGAAPVGVTVEVINQPVVVPAPVARAAEELGTREISSYTLGREEETDSTPCHGAWGDDLCAKARAGVRVCASNEFPKGTELIIGDGLECVVMDRMNSRYTTRVDVAELDHSAAKSFGVQILQVSTVK